MRATTVISLDYFGFLTLLLVTPIALKVRPQAFVPSARSVFLSSPHGDMGMAADPQRPDSCLALRDPLSFTADLSLPLAVPLLLYVPSACHSASVLLVSRPLLSN